MDSMSAFAMGEANRGKPLMVFDWHKAARLIKERGARSASAGLSGDWEYTGDAILEDGEPLESGYTYLSSTWAEPELVIDGGDPIPCYIMEDETEWDHNTFWPESALEILSE